MRGIRTVLIFTSKLQPFGMAALSTAQELNNRFPFKVELHCHLDGAIRPETVLEIAKQRKLEAKLPHKTVEELNRDLILKGPCSLKKFLSVFDYFMPIINGDRNAIKRVAREICEDFADQKTRYAEVRYCPHLLANNLDNHEYATEKGDVTPRDVVKQVNEGLEEGCKEFDITVKSILCCMTHRPEWSQEVLDLCKEFKDDGVVGIDIAGQEFEPGSGRETLVHKRVFQEAYRAGIHRTVHAGEVGPASAVREALDEMHAERIGHGYHALDDLEVYKRVLDERVHLEVCPISSIYTRACQEDIMKHPLITFVKDGVNFSINTDDPIVLGNSLDDDYEMGMKMGITDEQIIQSIFNAANACFAPEEEKKAMLEKLNEIYGPHI